MVPIVNARLVFICDYASLLKRVCPSEGPIVCLSSRRWPLITTLDKRLPVVGLIQFNSNRFCGHFIERCFRFQIGKIRLSNVQVEVLGNIGRSTCTFLWRCLIHTVLLLLGHTKKKYTQCIAVFSIKKFSIYKKSVTILCVIEKQME